MHILTDLKAFHPDPSRPLILGLGNFDGLHVGHQALLHSVVEKAKKMQGIAAILTFREHPQQILHPQSKPPLLITGNYKLFLLQTFGIELCFWLPFTETFSKMEPHEFVEKILVHQLQVKDVCLGYNAHFGHDRKGDVSAMRRLALQYEFQFEEIAPVKAAGDFVSSSRLRALVEAGDLDQVETCLGRSLSILGHVQKGSGRGKTLGFPTANMEISSEIMPPQGVYPVALRRLALERKTLGEAGVEEFFVRDQGPWLQGILNYGQRPTFQSGRCEKPVAEVFIFDFKGDLYGQSLEVVFYPRLRPEMKFEDADALKRQIEKDIAHAKSFFATLPKENRVHERSCE